MDELLSLTDIKKQGFKIESEITLKKGKTRYVYCQMCNKFTRTTLSPSNDELKIPCFWCNKQIIVRFK